VKSLSIDRAWNGVALEERISLISKAQAEGLSAAVTFSALIGSIAYGFDAIWLFFGGIIASIVIIPLFSSYSWRRSKPEAILKQLAVRSMSRRYAFGIGVPELDISLIFRGYLQEVFDSEEDEILKRSNEVIDIESAPQEERAVWIALLKGAVVILSERAGGAKLEFITALTSEVRCFDADEAKDGMRVVTVTGGGNHKGRKVNLWTPYPGALYVFERQLNHFVAENKNTRASVLEQIASKAALAQAETI
jgi:hypothetical protein